MPRFQENISLARYSHYKIGGPARFFFTAKTEKEVVWAVREAKKRKLKIFILSGGTNLLIGDDGFAGLVLRPAITSVKASGTLITAGAGIAMVDLLRFAMRQSYQGLEWAGGLPGTLGGAIRGNAGCFGGETKDVMVSVRSFDTKTMKIVTRSAKACRFAYRHSIFKKKQEIIIDAVVRLAKGDKKIIAASIRTKVAHRQKNHPLEHPNIGSMFKNVPLERIHAKESRRYREALSATTINFHGSQFSIKTDPFPVISAAKLIGETGLRGVSFGGAMISPKHPNFIVNVLGAESRDVKALIELAKAEVWNRFGVQLEEEVQII